MTGWNWPMNLVSPAHSSLSCSDWSSRHRRRRPSALSASPLQSSPASRSRSTTWPQACLGFALRALFTVIALRYVAAILFGQVLLMGAPSAEHPMAQIMAAVKVYPFDPEFRKALLEWPMLSNTEPSEAIEGLNMFIANDPYSPDAIRLRMKYESILGDSAAAQRDARRLQKFTPFEEQ